VPRPTHTLPSPSSPRDVPAYGLTEAARYVRVPPATLRSWVAGRPYPRGQGRAFFNPLIQLADRRARRLSFSNLVEAHVLRALRTEHGVPIRAVRAALDYAERELDISHLLLREDLRTGAGDLFLASYGELIDLSRSGQLALRRVLETYLKRVDWDRAKLPVRLHPFVVQDAHPTTGIAIDPAISFGRPIVLRKGVSTSAIVGRIDANETVDAVAEDYGLTLEEVELAVLYERAA
jgi:uncharacterized protein (DUF433 family)